MLAPSSRKHLVPFLLFLALLWVPEIGRWLDLDPSPPLAGVEQPEPLPRLGWKSLWSGDYQAQRERDAARGLGFRAALVRTDNQINLSVFHELKPKPALGRHDVLYEDGMHPRADWWLAGTEPFSPLVQNLAALDRELRARGILLLIVLAPNKARIWPEDLPERFARYAVLDKVPTVHSLLQPVFDALHLEVVDFPRLFAERKSPGEPRVFGRGGFHWNAYGAALATSEILSRCARLSGKPWPSIAIETVTFSDWPLGADSDLIKLSNIWDERRFWGGNPVPQLAASFPDGAERKRLVFVGTSYLWMLADALTQTRVLSRLELLYYFNTRVVFRDGVGPREEHEQQSLKTAQVDWGKELAGFDAVILEVPEFWLVQIGFGFIEAALRSMGVEPVR